MVVNKIEFCLVSQTIQELVPAQPWLQAWAGLDWEPGPGAGLSIGSNIPLPSQGLIISRTGYSVAECHERTSM